jgi:acyl-CoA synthetase (AMP-forming)/AMP-acid ligase II
VPAINDLSALLAALAARHGARDAVAGESEVLSFEALDAEASRWAAAFAAAGAASGAHVGLLAGNGPRWLAAGFGVWRAGATLVPISTFVAARELEEVLHHADVDVLVLEPQLRSRDHLALLRRCRLPQRLRDVVVLGGDAPRPYKTAAGFLSSSVPAEHVLDPESIACILYTSGTTGRPKGVQLSHRAILATVLPTAERTGLTGSDSLLSTLPLFWVAGLVIRALPTLACGSALVLPATFAVDAVVALLRRYRPTGIHLRPPQIGQLLAHPRFDPSYLANVRRGGGRVEWFSPLLDAADARLITGYGMTEMAGYVVALSWDDPPEVRRNQLGRPLPGVELRISRAGEADVGEILVRGPGLFSGYYKEPPGTGLDGDGFFRTGDLGSLDRAGFLRFVGRSKDLLRVKGINVSPLEVETVLQSHPVSRLPMRSDSPWMAWTKRSWPSWCPKRRR